MAAPATTVKNRHRR